MAQPIPISDIERYMRGLYLSEAAARTAPSREFQQFWNTIAGSYRFLLDRENRHAARTGSEESGRARVKREAEEDWN